MASRLSRLVAEAHKGQGLPTQQCLGWMPLPGARDDPEGHILILSPWSSPFHLPLGRGKQKLKTKLFSMLVPKGVLHWLTVVETLSSGDCLG